MNPIARDATSQLAVIVSENPSLLENVTDLKKHALYAIVSAYTDAGKDPERDHKAFHQFLENHAGNVLDLAVSVVLCGAKTAQRKQMWGNVGKAAALVGAAALGAFFG